MDDVEQASQRLIQSERIATRAVVVPDGEDPTRYLREAGILEPIALAFAHAGAAGAARSMSDGATPGVQATIVFDAPADPGAAPGPSEQDAQPTTEASSPEQ